MQTKQFMRQGANEASPRRAFRTMKCLAVLACCCVGLVTLGCGDDVTPPAPNTSIAGKWQVTCQPVNEDCPNFTVTFDAAGDIAAIDLDGHRGAHKGYGRIADAKLFISIGFGTIYEFKGPLDPPGTSATGTMTNFDYDGEQKTTPATVARQ